MADEAVAEVEVPAEEVAPAEVETETPVAGAEETASEEVAAPEEAGEFEIPAEINEKINAKIAKHKYEARRATEDAEYWKQRAQPEQAAPAAVVEDVEPKLDNYEDYDLYQRDLIRFETKQTIKAQNNQNAQNNQRQAYESKKQTVIAKGNTDHEDFYAVTSQIPLSEFAMAAATELENGSDTVYYLGKNPTEATRIFGLSPVQQVMELNNISNRLATPVTKKPSDAPEPITPITTEGNTELKYKPGMSQADYGKLRAQRKKAAAARS